MASGLLTLSLASMALSSRVVNLLRSGLGQPEASGPTSSEEGAPAHNDEVRRAGGAGGTSAEARTKNKRVAQPGREGMDGRRERVRNAKRGGNCKVSHLAEASTIAALLGRGRKPEPPKHRTVSVRTD